MKNHGELIEIASVGTNWGEVAREIVSANWLLHDQVCIEAGRLVGLVLSGSVSTEELRGGVAWACALDKESVAIYGSDITEGSQRLERTARRLMHQSGREALSAVGSRRRREMAFAQHSRQIIGK